MNPLKLLLDYRVTDSSVQVHTFGGILLADIPLTEISSVYHGFPLFGLHELWLNRLDVWETAVTLRRKQGLRRHVIVTPDQPEQFVATVRSLLRRQRQS